MYVICGYKQHRLICYINVLWVIVLGDFCFTFPINNIVISSEYSNCKKGKKLCILFSNNLQQFVGQYLVEVTYL
jgi:hypothetical protein